MIGYMNEKFLRKLCFTSIVLTGLCWSFSASQAAETSNKTNGFEISDDTATSEINKAWLKITENNYLDYLLAEQLAASKAIQAEYNPGDAKSNQEAQQKKKLYLQKRKALIDIFQDKNLANQAVSAKARKNILAALEVIPNFVTPNKSEEKYSPLSKYLELNHKDGKFLSSLEWTSIASVYGDCAYKKFVKTNFNISEINTPSEITPVPIHKETEVILVSLPLQKELIKDQKNKDELGDYSFHEFIISSYGSLEEQAEELSHFLQMRKNKETPVLLLSHEESSGIVRKYLDLHPGSRKHPLIQAWINFNGKLYGEKISPKFMSSLAKEVGRGLASAEKEMSPAEKAMLLHALKNQEDRKNPVLPLGDGFPIITVLTKDRANTNDLHEAVLVDGKNYIAMQTSKEFSLEDFLSQWMEESRNPASTEKTRP